MEQKLLDILCSPGTHQSLRVLTGAELEKLNQAIAAGHVTQKDGTPMEQPLREALITEDGQDIYPISDGIPVLLAESAIAWKQIDNASAENPASTS